MAWRARRAAASGSRWRREQPFDQRVEVGQLAARGSDDAATTAGPGEPTPPRCRVADGSGAGPATTHAASVVPATR